MTAVRYANPLELMTLDEVAEYVPCSVRLARRLVDEQRIRTYRVGRFVRISRADLDQWIAASVVDGAAATASMDRAWEAGWNEAMRQVRDYLLAHNRSETLEWLGGDR